jgi:hypothetical protein
MRLSHLTGFAFGQIFSRMRRRAIGAALLGLFALAALYQFTVAGSMALEAEYGALYARLIVAGIYTLAALTAFIALWATRAKPAAADDAVLAASRNMQIAMLVEAAVLGYSLARKIPGR